MVRKSKSKNPLRRFFSYLRIFISDNKIFPIVLCTTVVCILFILFRMKGIEQDYARNSLQGKIKTLTFKGKELRLQKAKLESIGNLRKIARKYKLKRPKQNQIIVLK